MNSRDPERAAHDENRQRRQHAVPREAEIPGARRVVGRHSITSLFDNRQYLRSNIAVAEFGSISHAAKVLGTT